MPTLAITVIAQDGPGIIARVTDALAAERMNLADSSMTVLRGQLAMTLICTGDTDADRVRQIMNRVADHDLIINVTPVPGAGEARTTGASSLLTVHGADRIGIVAALTGVVAGVGGNITDLTTHLAADLYVLTAEVDLPPTTDIESLQSKIDIAAGELGVDARLRPVEQDEL
jgi:glycine cleavage system transcriptional repressor